MARTVPRKLLAGVVILTGLAVGSAIDSRMPSTSDVLARPFVHRAAVGQAVTMRTAEVSVAGVSSARSVVSYGREFSTEGTWLLIDMQVLALRDPVLISGMELVTSSGLVYGGSGDVSFGCATAQPGVPQDCRVAMEVAPGDLPGLELHVPTSGEAGSPGDDMMVVDLGITPGSPVVTSPVERVEIVRSSFGGDS
jgi:hypothetical protein